MSLKKKIALSFFISAFIIAILATFEYVNFVEIRKEIRFLELTDTIRSKSLQLRRHEKNFFLYGSLSEEARAIYQYLGELDALTGSTISEDKKGMILSLRKLIGGYRQRFTVIETSVRRLSGELGNMQVSSRDVKFFQLMGITFQERPLQSAEILQGILPPDHRLIAELRELDAEINALRKSGEDLLVTSKEIDRLARENVDRTIYISQIAIIIFFPLFFISGLGTLFFIGRNVVNRLRLLIDVVERTGSGTFPHVAVPLKKWGGNDEVGVLINKFNDMEDQLSLREHELDIKNRELLQSKKLAAIGTLASGVAHELNNPLNNIYISAQVLMRETGEDCPPLMKEIVNDIVGQTARVKRIVGDLLEFARGREPRFSGVELNGLITDAFKLIGSSVNVENIKFELDSGPEGVIIRADRGQLEQVFVNLFNNAVEAMAGVGELRVRVSKGRSSVTIKVSDTGRGMPGEALEKIFEPFFTTKDKGTGLGLAIVFNTIKKHNGEIAVESEAGKGTTFIITLPAGEDSHEL